MSTRSEEQLPGVIQRTQPQAYWLSSQLEDMEDSWRSVGMGDG